MASKRISLKTGTLVVPEGFIVDESTKTDNADYAGVVHEIHYTTKFYVVFSEKPIKKMSEGELEVIYTELGLKYPEIQSVIDAEVSAVYDDYGNMTNLNEWLGSVRLSLAGIPDLMDEKELYLGTGIVRRT